MNNNSHSQIRFRLPTEACAAIVRVIAIALLFLLASCGTKPDGTATLEKGEGNAPRTPSTAIEAAPIIDRYRALDNSRDRTTRIRASISGASDGSALGAPQQILFNLYRKRQPDGRQLILIEFTSPPEERDRDGLITVFADGQVEGVRYVQSTDSYIVTRDLMTEDALFGLTLQELADGQPEKYEFTISGEDTVDGTECYRAEGKLKADAQSKFSRVVLLISKQTFAAVKAMFYDNHNDLARELVVSTTEQIAGYSTRVRWTIDNPAREKKIAFEALDVRYDQNLKDSIFTREHLKEIASR
jgi:hypothetical protein